MQLLSLFLRAGEINICVLNYWNRMHGQGLCIAGRVADSNYYIILAFVLKSRGCWWRRNYITIRYQLCPCRHRNQSAAGEANVHFWHLRQILVEEEELKGRLTVVKVNGFIDNLGIDVLEYVMQFLIWRILGTRSKTQPLNLAIAQYNNKSIDQVWFRQTVSTDVKIIYMVTPHRHKCSVSFFVLWSYKTGHGDKSPIINHCSILLTAFLFLKSAGQKC